MISPNTAKAAARAIRQGHGSSHDDGDACMELAARLEREAHAAGLGPPEVDVTVSIHLRGSLATIEAAGELTAALDVMLSQRYPDYRGVAVKLDVPLMAPAEQGRAGDVPPW